MIQALSSEVGKAVTLRMSRVVVGDSFGGVDQYVGHVLSRVGFQSVGGFDGVSFAWMLLGWCCGRQMSEVSTWGRDQDACV